MFICNSYISSKHKNENDLKCIFVCHLAMHFRYSVIKPSNSWCEQFIQRNDFSFAFDEPLKSILNQTKNWDPSTCPSFIRDTVPRCTVHRNSNAGTQSRVCANLTLSQFIPCSKRIFPVPNTCGHNVIIKKHYKDPERCAQCTQYHLNAFTPRVM